MLVSADSLLDRLITPFGDPGNNINKSNNIYRLCNDFALLFNSTGLSNTCELRRYPQTARSVLNYGLGSFAGALLSSIDLKQLENRIRMLIVDFEPRVVSHSLEVRLLPNVGSASCFNFLLQGEVRSRDSQCSFRLQSSWNTESGEVRVRPYGNHHG